MYVFFATSFSNSNLFWNSKKKLYSLEISLFNLEKTGAVLNCVNGELIQSVAQVGVKKKVLKPQRLKLILTNNRT